MRRRYYPINQNIKYTKLRVIDPEGKNLGILNRAEALEAARSRKLDLVLITEKATPPVAKILNFKKFLYEKRKEANNLQRKNKLREGKTLRVGPHIDENDLEIRIGRAKEFLAAGIPVQFEMLFKGRTISHPEVGKKKLELIKAALSEEAKIERDIERKGRLMTMVLGPK